MKLASEPRAISNAGIPLRAWLLVVFLVAMIVGCIRPTSWSDLAYQHIPTVIAVILLIVGARRRPLSNTSYVLVLIFLVFHILGAHYLYSNVPYERWSSVVFGRGINETLGFTRNHYDRLVHFMFGVLCAPVAFEMGVKFGGINRRSWAVVFAVSLIAMFAGVYEVLEWLLTLVVSQEAAENYNGQQGDAFDAQKDQALSFIGSLLSTAWMASRSAASHREVRDGHDGRSSCPDRPR